MFEVNRHRNNKNRGIRDDELIGGAVELGLDIGETVADNSDTVDDLLDGAGDFVEDIVDSAGDVLESVADGVGTLIEAVADVIEALFD